MTSLVYVNNIEINTRWFFSLQSSSAIADKRRDTSARDSYVTSLLIRALTGNFARYTNGTSYTYCPKLS